MCSLSICSLLVFSVALAAGFNRANLIVVFSLGSVINFVLFSVLQY